MGRCIILGSRTMILATTPRIATYLERALPVYEREHGSDGAEVAEVLNELGTAYMGLGDYAKQRDVLERALAIQERAYGKRPQKWPSRWGTSGTRTAP